MKTEKKPSEPSCVPPIVVKEEPEGDRVKIKEETASSNNDDAPGEDTTECLKETTLETVTAEGTIGTDTQNGSANQTILNSVKQETDPISAVEELPTDCGSNVGIPGEGIQPLVSNVLVKQIGTGANTGEAQYMQQQSQIFVFSTQMANKGAEMVIQGQFPTIIAYHMAQPNTKKYLEKFPNKMMPFRQNPHQWLNNLGAIKQKGHQHSSSMGFPGEQPPDLPPLDPNDPTFWNEQPNIRNMNGSNPLGNPESSIDDTNVNVPCLVPNSPSNSVTANPQPIGNTAIGHSPNIMGGTTSPGPGGVQPSLQGVKVPDENLTPQQRQHREEQLAALTKMRQMLFPEQKDVAAGSMDPTQSAIPGSLCPTGSLPPASASNQCGPGNMDWHKMQHSFMDGKNKVGVGSPGVAVRGTAGGGMVGGTGGPGSVGAGGTAGVGGPRSQGPPPPYHQTTRSASVPIAIQSPNPSSPNNPTSNLSLPSPRASSALNSPADCNRQFQLGTGVGTTGPRSVGPGATGGHLPGQSPTSQDSPNSSAVTAVSNAPRLNHSNPGTPVSHGHLAALSPSGTPQKDPTLDFPSSQPPNVDGMFCRSLQSLTQQKQSLGSGGANQVGVKELMPVPSPQQISYLNTFEGQELTIQKQPNTSLKDGSLPANTQGNNNPDISNRMLSGNIESSGSVGNNQYGPRSEGASPSIESANRGFGGSLHSPHTPHTPHTPSSVAPHTPVDTAKPGNKTVSAQSSPASHNTSLTDMGMGPPRTIPVSPNTKCDTSPTSKELQQQQPPPQPQSQHQQQQQQPQQTQQPQQQSQQSQQQQPQSQQQQLQQHQQQQHQQHQHQQQQQQQPPPPPPPNIAGVVPAGQTNVSGSMMSSMVGPPGSAPFTCGRPATNVSQPNDNIPLNPNNISNRLGGLVPMSSTNFDPITSLAQMSQQLTNTAASSALGNDNSPIHAGNTQGMLPFNHPHNIHMMQIQQQQQVNEMNGSCHMGGGAGGGPTNDQDVSGLCMGLGGPTASYSPTPHTSSPGMPNKMPQHHPMMQHAMMGPGGPQGPGPNPNVNVSQPGGYPSGPGPGPGSAPGSGLMGPEGPQSRLGIPGQQPHQAPPHHQHVHGASPYNGANVQVKPSAPNTIQYLPARPNVGHAPRGPPSLDFLQRFANPMSGIDAKMNSPSVNLQYFPNGCVPPNNLGPGSHGPPHGNMGGPGHGAGPGGMPPGMSGNAQAVMGGQPQGHMHPSMRPVTGAGPQGPGVRQQANIMRMQHMVGGNVFPSSPMDPDKAFPPDMLPGPQMPGQTASPGMYGGPGPGQKQTNAMGQLGPPPDASQPLPPSMGGGTAGGNFKNTPFIGAGPSMSDPHYAQQYHHFQQQLYATGTRGSSSQAHPGMHAQPNSHAHQQFFMPK